MDQPEGVESSATLRPEAASVGHNSLFIQDAQIRDSPGASIGGRSAADDEQDCISNWQKHHTASLDTPRTTELFMTKGLQQILQDRRVEQCIAGNATVFLYGKPGAGKTSIAAGIIEHLRSQADRSISVACIQFSRKQTEGSFASETFMLFLQQLIRDRHHPHYHRVRKLYRDCPQGKNGRLLPSARAIADVLISALREDPQVCVVLDNVNDVSDHEGLQEVYRQLSRIQKEVRLGVIITSRHKNRDLKPWKQLEISAHRDDVEDFLLEYLALVKNEVVADMLRDENLRSRVLHHVWIASQGMFALVRLNVIYLATAQSRTQLDHFLDEILQRRPKVEESSRLQTELLKMNRDLHQLLHQDDQQTEMDVRRIVTWVLFAKRPLTVKELMSAIAQQAGEPNINHQDLKGAVQLSWMTNGLIEKNEYSGLVDFVSHFHRQYLLRSQQWRALLGFPHGQMAKTCVQFLSRACFSEGWYERDNHLRARRKNHPFLEYAARYWPDHYKQCKDTAADGTDGDFNSAHQATFIFLQKSSHVACAMQIMLLPDLVTAAYMQAIIPGYRVFLINAPKHSDAEPTVTDNSLYKDYHMTGLHMACLVGFTSLAKALFNLAPNLLDSTTRMGETPLLLTAFSGDIQTAKFLIEKGANVNLRDEDGFNPICRAMLQGHHDYVDLILELPEGRADIMAPVQSPSRIEGFQIAKGIHGSIRDMAGYTLLHFAAAEANYPLVRKLLARKVDAAVRDDAGMTPGHKAAKYGHLAILKLLVGTYNHSLVRVRSDDGRTLLHQSCKYSRREVVTHLVERFPQLTMKADKQGNLPLHLAVMTSGKEMVELLIQEESKEQLSAHNREGRTPIELAMQIGDKAIFDLLWRSSPNLDEIAESKEFKSLWMRCPNEEIRVKLLKFYEATSSFIRNDNRALYGAMTPSLTTLNNLPQLEYAATPIQAPSQIVKALALATHPGLGARRLTTPEAIRPTLRLPSPKETSEETIVPIKDSVAVLSEEELQLLEDLRNLPLRAAQK